MRAFVLDGYGAVADHVHLSDIADPVPAAEDVLIEIHAASLNPIDFKIVHGDLKRVSKHQFISCRVRSASMPAASCCRRVRA